MVVMISAQDIKHFEFHFDGWRQIVLNRRRGIERVRHVEIKRKSLRHVGVRLRRHTCDNRITRHYSRWRARPAPIQANRQHVGLIDEPVVVGIARPYRIAEDKPLFRSKRGTGKGIVDSLDAPVKFALRQIFDRPARVVIGIAKLHEATKTIADVGHRTRDFIAARRRSKSQIVRQTI